MNKRCNFLEHVVALIGLQNVRIVRDQAENVGQNFDFRENFDIAVARAVAEMRVLAEYCLPLVRVGGLFVAAKVHDPQEKVANTERAISLMGASLVQTCLGILKEWVLLKAMRCQWCYEVYQLEIEVYHFLYL